MNVARLYRAGTDSRDRIQFDCPGCQTTHEVPVNGQGAWSWNGRLDKPTLSPSLLVSTGPDDARRVWCHFFVRDGEIEFLPDSTGHQLRGKVPMTEFKGEDLQS